MSGIDKRIGTGSTFPVLDLFGNPYTRPATTRNIGNGRFVVVPAWASEASIQQQLATLTPVRKTLAMARKEETNGDIEENADSE